MIWKSTARVSVARIIVLDAALGLIPAIVGVLFAGFSWRVFRAWAISGLVYANFIGTICWTIGPQVSRAVAGYAMPAQMLVLFGVLTGAGLLGALAGNVVLHWFHLGSSPIFAIRISLAVTLSFGLLSLAITMLAERLDEAKREAQRRQLGEERARKMEAEARYASLESRVQPHFLFNTLNSIAALVRENPAEAERMIERLSGLLRYSLDSEAAGLVSLDEELRVVEAYLAIEQVRFGERLRYRFEVDEGARGCRVPALSVQTLVENSVKYGVGTRREGGEITVRAQAGEQKLRVEVCDDGPGFEPSISLKPGHGLDLVRQRLENVFGAAASLEMASGGGTTRVAICVPV